MTRVGQRQKVRYIYVIGLPLILLGGKSSDFDRPTSKILTVYNSEAAPFDKALIDSWTKDMDGILIFVSFAT